MKTTMFFKVGLFLIIVGLTTMVVVNTNNTNTNNNIKNKKPIPDIDEYINELDSEPVLYDWVRHGQIEELALTLYMEERTSEELMREVASVIMNRVNRPMWPNTIEEVIFQPQQFSCWDEGRDRYIDTPEKGWIWAIKIAHEMYNGTFQVTNNGDHYWVPSKIKAGDHQWRKGLILLGMKGKHQFAIHP